MTRIGEPRVAIEGGHARAPREMYPQVSEPMCSKDPSDEIVCGDIGFTVILNIRESVI